MTCQPRNLLDGYSRDCRVKGAMVQHRLYYRVVTMAVGLTSSGQVLARFGQALADPTRARVLLALRDAPGYPAELADLIGVSRQVMSNHLACLRGCGLVVAVPEGRRARYQLADSRLAYALGDLIRVVLAADPSAQISEEEGDR